MWDTMLYSVPLLKNDGTEVRLLVMALDCITGPLVPMDIRAAAKMFGIGVWEIMRPVGHVDLLIGIQSASIFPTVRDTKGNLRLLSPQFGSGILLEGAHPDG